MRRKWPAVLVGALAAALVSGLFGGRGELDRRPAAPADGPDVAAAPPKEPPARAFDPASVPLPLPSPPAAATEAAGAGGNGPDPRQELLRFAYGQLGSRLRELGDVTAYLDGKPGEEWRLVEIPPELRDRILDLLTAGTPELRVQAALALSAAELRPEDVDRLRERFDAELSGVSGEARKNLVLALAFALHTHDDRHGVAALADSLRTGDHADVKGFRDGATLVLALADDAESAPLLRDLLAADPDRGVRKNAAVGLGRLGGGENRTALDEALVREEDLEVRAWAALAAGRAAVAGADDAPLRRALVEDTAGEVRGAAAFALGQTGSDGTVEALTATFYGDDHPFARIGAVAGIAARNADGASSEFLAAQATPCLDDIVRHCEDGVARFYAITALAMMPPSGTRSAALRYAAANETSEWVKIAAIDRLVETEGEAARPFLEARMSEETSNRVRAHLEAAAARADPENR